MQHHDEQLNDLLSAHSVASLPPPGLNGPTNPVFAPRSSRYLAFVSSTASSVSTSASIRAIKTPQALYRPLTSNDTPGSANSSNGLRTTPTPSGSTGVATTTVTTTTNERILLCMDLQQPGRPLPKALLQLSSGNSNNNGGNKTISTNDSQHGAQQRSKRRLLDTSAYNHFSSNDAAESLQERLRRERQRMHLTQFSWAWCSDDGEDDENHQQMHTSHHHHQQTTSRSEPKLKVLVPARGSLWIQDGVLDQNGFGGGGSRNGYGGGGSTVSSRLLHDKSLPGNAAAVDPQLSPDGKFVAWTQADGEIYCKSTSACATDAAIRLSYGASHSDDQCVTHGVADFVAQEEMDRYRGFWWHPDSNGILFTKVDESHVPIFRIVHSTAEPSAVSSAGDNNNKDAGGEQSHEDHRYPFAGKRNPTVILGYVRVDVNSIRNAATTGNHGNNSNHNSTQQQQQQQQSQSMCLGGESSPAMALSPAATMAHSVALTHWKSVMWLEPPREASEYMARVYWAPDGHAIVQWQNRSQNVSVLQRIDLARGKGRPLVLERSDVWINLHHMFHALPQPIHPKECGNDVETASLSLPYPLPPGSFSFLWASEISGYLHLYLYTYAPGVNNEQAVLVRAVSSGEWMVEHICGVDLEKDVVYCTGTFDSPLERHLYALPLTNQRPSQDTDESMGLVDTDLTGGSMRRGLSKMITAFSGVGASSRKTNDKANQIRPLRLTVDGGTHNIVMDENCRYFVDTSSDLDRPTSVKVFELNDVMPFNNSNGGCGQQPLAQFKLCLFDAVQDDKSSPQRLINGGSNSKVFWNLPAPEILSFPTGDGAETLYAALYRPDPRIHGPGPYPLVCAVYGGPHVQRVNRSWSQCADMRAQRLRHLGFCVVKCDNRGSSRRGVAFEAAIARRLGRVEVLDQVAAVRQLIVRGIADPTRVGVYGWSYGGYLAAMCLCRAPDIFHVAVAGAPVTSWDGYDTHYTERYMGLPDDNISGYRESAVFDHIPNMRGKLMLVHGLIDENVHFRHTARLINKLTAADKDYELLIFPDERHSPRRLRDRIYMEQRISDFFLKHLSGAGSALDLIDTLSRTGGLHGFRTMAGHL